MWLGLTTNCKIQSHAQTHVSTPSCHWASNSWILSRIQSISVQTYNGVLLPTVWTIFRNTHIWTLLFALVFAWIRTTLLIHYVIIAVGTGWIKTQSQNNIRCGGFKEYFGLKFILLTHLTLFPTAYRFQHQPRRPDIGKPGHMSVHKKHTLDCYIPITLYNRN